MITEVMFYVYNKKDVLLARNSKTKINDRFVLIILPTRFTKWRPEVLKMCEFSRFINPGY